MTCFLVKVRSCLLAKALMRASERMARLQHFWYDEVVLRLFSNLLDKGLGIFFTFVKEAWHGEIFCLIGYLFLCFQDIALISIGAKKFDHGLREEFFLSHGSALHIDQRLMASFYLDHLDAGLLGLNLPRKGQGLMMAGQRPPSRLYGLI